MHTGFYLKLPAIIDILYVRKRYWNYKLFRGVLMLA